MRFSIAFHESCALWCTASKVRSAFSASRLACALPVDTQEMPTLACTTWFAVVSKVRYSPLGPAGCGAASCAVCVDPGRACGAAAAVAKVPLVVNGRSNFAAKYIAHVGPAPQKWPVVTDPTTSVLLTTVTLVPLTGVWLPASLISRLACLVAGKVNRPIPDRVIAVSPVVMPESPFTR